MNHAAFVVTRAPISTLRTALAVLALLGPSRARAQTAGPPEAVPYPAGAEALPPPPPPPPGPAPAPAAAAVAPPVAPPVVSPRADIPASAERDLLTFYKDNYFLTGFTGNTEVKFQFSAKFDLWPNDGPHAVYLGYSQKSLWDLYRPSSEFVETNYNPELFYAFYHHDYRYATPAGCGFFRERAGLEHESNGEGANKSRGWNRVYIESKFACYSAGSIFGSVALKVWAPPFGASDNPTITRHLGYGELTLSVGSEHGTGWLGDVDLTVVARKGTNRALAEGSLEIDGRWRPPYASFWRFTPYLFGQIFTGYGETLLRYDDAVTAFRVGIGLSDTSARAK